MKPKLNIKSTTFLFFFITLVLLAVVHNIAEQLSLYWLFIWFDIPMHFLGGMVVAFGFLSFYEMRSAGRGARLRSTVLFVLLIGLLWEVFEYSAGISLATESALLPDTFLDLIMDLFGGAIAFYITERMRILDNDIAV